MLNLLVTIDHSLEASFALRSACLFGNEISIQPIYIFEPPGRDIAFGAGWARKSWERETSLQAEKSIEDLVSAERGNCPNILDPVVLSGDPVQKLSEYFWSGQFDLLVVGAPFRGWASSTLGQRFGQAARRARRSLSLMVVRRLMDIKQIVVFTDGGSQAENALGILLRVQALSGGHITIVGMSRDKQSVLSKESLNVERAMAILEEKGVEATVWYASEMGPERLSSIARTADLVVNPVFKDDPLYDAYKLAADDIKDVLLYLKGR